MSAEHFDAVVVGSGFGGSVTACRLAEAGLDVCVLERGRAYPPGSFPRSPREMSEAFWDPSEGLRGMFDLWSFRGLEALVSSGLGGGSLIYANVLLRKDENWFVTEGGEGDGYESWPVTRADLDPHYDRVEAMLKPQRYPVGTSPYDTTPKTRALAGAAARLGLDLQYPPLAVTFANPGRPPVPGEEIVEDSPNLHGAKRYTCRLVGECDVGCNWGAKNSLDYTYLSAAKLRGAELRTGAEVQTFAPEKDGFRIAYRTHPDGGERVLTANRLVLAAGTLGSTFLLLRNQGSFPGLEGRLGTRFCGNGDLLSFAIDCDEPVEAARGPVITTAIRYADELDGGEGRGFYLEDGGVPEFVSWLVQMSEAPSSARRALSVLWRQLRQRFLDDPESNLSAEAASLLGDGRLGSHYLPFLGMGRDVPDGKMSLSRRGNLEIDWTTRTSRAYFERVRAETRRVAEALGAKRLMDNPTWRLRRVITVHPLGGCPIGGEEGKGVVDARTGQVWGHPGLFVADGSVMPGPVGANPSLTIAALADRFADAALEAGGAAGSAGMAARPVPPATAGERAPAIAVSFTEEMKGFVARGAADYESGFQRGKEERNALMFHLTITAADIDAFMAEPEGDCAAEGYVRCEALGGELPVERGVFNLFVDQDGDRRSKRMLYRLHFADGGGEPLTLSGFKVVEDDPGLDLWADTTTLYTQLLPGHVGAGEEGDAKPLAMGIIHIHGLDFAKQLTTFRSHPSGHPDALARFGRLFAGDLWEVYGPASGG